MPDNLTFACVANYENYVLIQRKRKGKGQIYLDVTIKSPSANGKHTHTGSFSNQRCPKAPDLTLSVEIQFP